MGLLEDQAAQHEEREKEKRRQSYCTELRKVGPLVAPAIAHFKANPQNHHSLGWFLIDGEAKAAWSLGSYGHSYDGWAGSIYLLPDGTFIAGRGYSNRDSPERPYGPQDPFGYKFVDLTSSPSHALVAGQEDQIKAIITHLGYKLAPQPKPPRKRSRLAEFFSPTTY